MMDAHSFLEYESLSPLSSKSAILPLSAPGEFQTKTKGNVFFDFF